MIGQNHAVAVLWLLGSYVMGRLSVHTAKESKSRYGSLLMSESPKGVEGNPSTLVHDTATQNELVKTQRQKPATYFAAMNAVQHNTQRRLVWALIQNDGRVSYNELKTLTTVSERTQRKHVSNLVDEDLINRIDANFTFIEFASVEAEALLKHALSVWYDSTA